MTDEQIKSRFAEAGDFVTRTLRCDGNTLYAYYIDGLTSGGDISEYVFRPISENLSGNLEEAYDAAPVSYTHLDVYKRQYLRGALH